MAPDVARLLLVCCGLLLFFRAFGYQRLELLLLGGARITSVSRTHPPPTAAALPEPRDDDVQVIKTPLTRWFDLDVPVFGAPMAGVAGGELARAVSLGGGLGMIGVGSDTPVEWLAEQAQASTK